MLANIFSVWDYLARTKLITFLTTQNAKGKPITNTTKRFKSVNKSPTYANIEVIKLASIPEIIVANIFLYGITNNCRPFYFIF